MQQKKNVRLLVLLLILVSSTSAFYFFKSPDGRLEVDKNKFSVEHLSKIDKVILESPGGIIELKYNGTSWKVNDRYEADQQLITVLFATLEQAEPKRPVAADENSSVVNQIANEGVKVNLLEGSELKKTFISGGNSEKTVTYFYEPGDKPYVMTIPGYRIYVASILELDENGWKDKRVFNFNWRNFKSMNVTFPANSKEDFAIGQRDGFFNVIGMETDTTRLNDFLDDVSLLVGDQIISTGKFPRYDSLLTSTPSLSIVITDIANRNYQLKLFAGLKEDPAIVGRVNDGVAMVFDRKKVFKIAKNKSYFKRRNE